jgi:hypothetical protein
MEGCCVLGAIDRGACGFSNEKSFTYCARTPIWGIATCGWGPPFVADMLVSGSPAGVAIWLTQGRRADNGGRPPAIPAANAADFGGIAQMDATEVPMLPALPMLARRRQSSKL